ncbi:HAD family hydrolase [Corynebacterium senegalense]|uniref:HAD family hydrolase n=1 Tax=Corynebacterium senegalense TaxID=2080750 RepID=UPI000E20964D|nr:HAD-IB family hydrolase [Corynebacterium senegalense]
MSADFVPLPGSEFLAQWSASQGNLRRFLEDTALPPLDDASQRAAGEAAAAAAVQETFGLDLDQFALGVDSVGGAFASAGSSTVTAPDPDIPQDAQAAAFFDIDNTLIQGSSLVLLAAGLARHRFITLRELLPGLIKQVRFRLSGTENHDDIASGREQALGLVKGKSVAELKELCAEIVEQHMLSKAYQPTIELASMHIAAGQQVWLVSATPVQIGQALAQRLGFTGALGTVAEEEDGRFTGRLVGDILHGPGKKHAVAALAAVQQLDLAQCTAYSDSVNDIPMLSMVGTPVAINPDRSLRAHAERAGWEIREYRSVRRLARSWALPLGAALAVGAALVLRRRRG